MSSGSEGRGRSGLGGTGRQTDTDKTDRHTQSDTKRRIEGLRKQHSPGSTLEALKPGIDGTLMGEE